MLILVSGGFFFFLLLKKAGWSQAKFRHDVLFIFFRSVVSFSSMSAKSAVLRILMSARILCIAVSTVADLLVTRVTSSLFFFCSSVRPGLCLVCHSSILFIERSKAFPII